MYRIQDSGALVSAHRTLLRPRTGERRLVSRTVVLLGVTSLLTDVSAEMVATVLPLYLVYVAGLTPLQFGLIDGFYRGAAALVGLVSGFAADRRRRHKEIASVGYGLSAACKLALVGVGGAVGAIGAIVMLDRIGKGIRTAPRDALISLSSSREGLGTAFGVHRAMDTVGAMLGPLIAFGLLALAPLAFESVFLVSFCFALAGLGVIVLLVPSKAAPAASAPTPTPTPSLRGATRLLVIPRFGGLVVAAVLLGVATISDAFLYLALQPTSTCPPAPSRSSSSARRCRSCCLPCRWAGSPTGSAGGVSSSPATHFCCRYTRCCSCPPWACSCWCSDSASWAPRTRPPTGCWRLSARRRCPKRCARAALRF